MEIPGLESIGCLHFETTEMNWNAAQSNCEDLGGSLLKLESDAQFNLLKEHFGKAVLSLWVDLF